MVGGCSLILGVGAVSYVEYARRLLPDPGESDQEINNLTAALAPGMYVMCVHKFPFDVIAVVYWLVFFSIVIHGLSVPILNQLYKQFKVPIIRDHPVEIIMLSEHEPIPNNSDVNYRGHSVVLNNRFSRCSNQQLHIDHNEHRSEDSDTMMLRRSGDTNYTRSLERASTKGSSREVEATICARNVV